MLFGILSDTHGFLHPALPALLAGVDLILHAGDVGSADVLDALEAIAPLCVVRGNIDGTSIRQRAPEIQSIVEDGVHILMTHIGGHPGRWATGIHALLRRERPDVFVCGHSHILRIERVPDLGGMLYLNPGAAGRQGFHLEKTCVRLRTEDGALKEAEVVHLDREDDRVTDV